MTQTFRFRDLAHIPCDNLEEGATYIVSSWDSNSVVRILPLNEFKVLEHNGMGLDLDKDYILIKPLF